MIDSISEDTVRPTIANEQKWRQHLAAGMNDIVNKELGIPARYHGKSLSNLVGLDAEKARAKQAVENGQGLFIFGNVGLGKTHMAVGAMLDWYSCRWNRNPDPDERCHGHFQSANDFLLDCKAAINGKSTEKGAIDSVVYMSNWRRLYDLIVMDDLAAFKMTDYAATMLAALIDTIYRNKKPVPIITCNFDVNGVARIIDDRTASRIAEMCVPVKLTGVDRRVAGAAA